MNKLVMTFGAAVALCVATTAVSSFAATYSETASGIDWTYQAGSVLADGTTAATLGDGSSACIATSTAVDAANIPWTFTDNGTDYTVTAIAAKAFYGCSGLSGTLTIPDAVTSMGKQAFYHCSSLSAIASLGGVTKLLEDTFRMSDASSTALPGSDYPDMSRLTSIGKNVFGYCGMGGTVRLDSLSSGEINCDSVFNRAAVTNIVFPRRAINLTGNYMFMYNTRLEGFYFPGPDSSGVAMIRKSQCFDGDTALKVFLAGPRTGVSTKWGSSDANMFNGISGCRIFVPAGNLGSTTYYGDWDTYLTDEQVNGNTVLRYGSGRELDLSFDHDTKTITAMPATAHALTNVLAAASTFKGVFGYNTKICMTNAIEVAEGTLTDELAGNVQFESLVFNVKTQAQLDMVLAATDGVSTPLCLDPSGAKEKMVLPADRKAWVLLSGEGEYRPYINGFIISFR